MQIFPKVAKGSINKLFSTARIMLIPKMEEVLTCIGDYQNAALRRATHVWSYHMLQLNIGHHLVSLLHALDNAKEREQSDASWMAYKILLNVEINALLQVTNGMAHRILDHNNVAIEALRAAGTRSNLYAIKDEGFAHAVQVAAVLADHEGAQVLLTDLTEAIGIGDLIVRKQDGWELWEVKKGEQSRGGRLHRQVARMENSTSFIRLGVGTPTGEDRVVHGIPVPCRRNHLDKLHALLHACDGTIEQITGYQFISAVDTRNMSDEELRKWEASCNAEADSRFGVGRWFDIDSLYGRESVSMIKPFTVYPFGPDLVAELLLGAKIFKSYIGLDHVAQAISLKGWDVVDVLEGADLDPKDFRNWPRGYQDGAIMHIFWKGERSRNCTFIVDFLVQCGLNMIALDSIVDALHTSVFHSPESLTFMPLYDTNEGWL